MLVENSLGTGSKIENLDQTRIRRGFDPLLSSDEIQTELTITHWASEHEIAPRIYASDTTVIEMERVNGKHIQQLAADQIIDLAKMFRKLHALTPPDNIPQPKRTRSLDHFFQIYSQMEEKTSVPPYLIKIKQQLEKFQPFENLVVCHGDLHANNVLFTGDELFFIDWTCAGLDTPIRDLSVAAMFWNFDSQQEEILLNAYYEGSLTVSIEKFHAYKSFAKIYWAMWPIMALLAKFPKQSKELGKILGERHAKPTNRSFEEYRQALFAGTFGSLINTFDDWVDLHLARIHASNFSRDLIL